MPERRAFAGHALERLADRRLDDDRDRALALRGVNPLEALLDLHHRVVLGEDHLHVEAETSAGLAGVLGLHDLELLLLAQEASPAPSCSECDLPAGEEPVVRIGPRGVARAKTSLNPNIPESSGIAQPRRGVRRPSPPGGRRDGLGGRSGTSSPDYSRR